MNKQCVRCKSSKHVSEFYLRSGHSIGTDTGHYLSECKSCMLERSKTAKRLDASEPRAATEIFAIDYLKSQGIPCLPGKAVSFAHVDVVAFGCVTIEVKYARLESDHGTKKFVFSSTPQQVKRGYLADALLLICEYSPNEKTYHIFSSHHPVFYIHDRVKNGFTFTPGALVAKKHGENRVVMTQPLMDEHQNKTGMLWDLLFAHVDELKASNPLALPTR